MEINLPRLDQLGGHGIPEQGQQHVLDDPDTKMMMSLLIVCAVLWFVLGTAAYWLLRSNSTGSLVMVALLYVLSIWIYR